MIMTLTTALAALAASAPSDAPRIYDIDADLRADGRVVLEAETTLSASQVQFTYRGRKVAGRAGAVDAEDGTRDWRRVVPARGDDDAGSNTVVITVRACDGDACVTRSERERLEYEDD